MDEIPTLSLKKKVSVYENEDTDLKCNKLLD